MDFNLARLFAYTRHIEQQLKDERARHSLAEKLLRDDRDEERNERRRLQDRVLNKAGVLPVFEPTAPSKPAGDVGIKKQLGPRQATVAAGVKRGEVLYEKLEKEVAQFKQDYAADNGGQASRPESEASD